MITGMSEKVISMLHFIPHEFYHRLEIGFVENSEARREKLFHIRDSGIDLVYFRISGASTRR